MMCCVSARPFPSAWARLVTAWSAAGESSAEAAALVQHALDVGIDALELPAVGDAGEVAVGQGRRCEVAVVRLAGAVDEAGYLAHNPEVAEEGRDPVDHFCRRGWRRLCNPSRDFDVWWYLAEYLDPTDDSKTATNPLVHFLLDGRHRGLAPLPRGRTRPEHRLPARPRRACLFAAYDADVLVDDTGVDYVAELARHSEVFACFDGNLQSGQADRLAPHASGVWERRHGAHDFGSYSALARDLVGWDALATYDEVVLANDSCWLLRPLDAVFARMDARAADFWGLQITARYFEPEPGQPQAVPLAEVRRSWLPPTAFRPAELIHIGSYFLALRAPVLADPGFRRRLDQVRPQRHRGGIVAKYEIGLTQYLIGQGYGWDTWLPELRPNHPIYGPGAFTLPAEGFPLFKRRFLIDNPYDTPGLPRWRERLLEAVPDAPVDRFEAHLRRVADPDALARSLGVTT